MLRRAGRRERQEGQILVLFTLVLVILMGFAALVIDVGVLRKSNQDLWNSLDSGALAGAPSLPGNGAAAIAAARKYATENYPGLDPTTIDVTFRCVVGDRNNDGVPDAGDVPYVCNPGAAGAGTWRCANGICAATCDPATAGNSCNTIVLSSTVTVDYKFGPAIGVGSGTTQLVLSAACVGPCGAAPTVPVDLALIVDRTSSMDATDLNDAKNGAYEVLKIYDPEVQYIAFGILGPSRTTGTCSGSDSPALGLPSTTVTGSVTWLPVGLTGVGAPVNARYRNTDGTIDTSSLLYKTIHCMTNSSTGTILSTPLSQAHSYLLANGRSGVTKGIIFMTDGAPNGDTCLAAVNAAAAAKAAGIEIFTVGFGVGGGDLCESTGAWAGKSVTKALAAMATSSTDDGCTVAENTDGDHYFCQPKSGDLNAVFKTAAAQLVRSTRLISLP
jgi:hypothetical protein